MESSVATAWRNHSGIVFETAYEICARNFTLPFHSSFTYGALHLGYTSTYVRYAHARCIHSAVGCDNGRHKGSHRKITTAGPSIEWKNAFLTQCIRPTPTRFMQQECMHEATKVALCSTRQVATMHSQLQQAAHAAELGGDRTTKGVVAQVPARHSISLHRTPIGGLSNHIIHCAPNTTLVLH